MLSKRGGIKSKTVMIFGVFDRLHGGHLHFLREAAKYGKVIAVVARDKAVKELKKRVPFQNERARLARIQRAFGVFKAVLGDEVQGTYGVLKKYKPDVVCLGYDQRWLERNLKEKIIGEVPSPPKLVRISPYRPHDLHTSLLAQRE